MSHREGLYRLICICDGCGREINTSKVAAEAYAVFDADPPSPIYVVCSARCRVALVEREGFEDYQARKLFGLPDALGRALRGEAGMLR